MSESNSTGKTLPIQAKKSSTKKLTTEIFIERSIACHGNTYGYDKAEYINNRIPIKIFCYACNSYFEQSPERHMTGKGCKACGAKLRGNNRRWNKEVFIEKANEVHGIGKYDYSLVDYKSSMHKVKIICKEHDYMFEQKVNSHIQGQGCPKCAGKLITQDEFIESSKIVHSNKYDYSKTKYVNSHTKVIVICKKHGDFSVLPPNHRISKQGCKKCAVEESSKRYTKTYSDFLKQAIDRHGSRYKYNDIDYKNVHSKVNICCEHHGWFKQTGTSHLGGSGCPACAKHLSGYNRSRFSKLCDKNNKGIGSLYLIKCFSESEEFYKIGITSQSLSKRYRSYKSMPYQYEVLHQIIGDAAYIYDLETQIHRLLKSYHYEPLKPFKGSVYECSSKIPKDVEKLLKTLENSKQIQLVA